MSQELEGTLTNTANLVGTFGSEGGGGTSNYNDLINKPSINSVTLQGNKTAAQLGLVSPNDLSAVATSGNYNDLINKPVIPDAQVNSDWNATSGVAEILNKPTIPEAQVNSDWNATSGVAEILNKPTIPAAQVNSDWNAVSGVAEILNKPILASVATSGAYSDLTGTPTIPAAQVNSDWNSTSGVSEILNKPTVYQNAAELPISSSDPTDTKSYIDTGLSGKIDKAYTSSTFTNDSASVSIGSKNIIYKQGNVVYITLVLVISGNISGGAHLVHSSIDLGSDGYIMAINDTNGAHMLATNGTYIDALLPIQSGTNLRISFALFVP